MLELYQAEWCPSSRRVRQRLTELGLDHVSRQVPAQREARIALRQAVGSDTIPALRLENGAVIVGADNILAYLGEYVAESPEAEAHRQRAVVMRRRYLEDECDCSHSAQAWIQRDTRPSRTGDAHLSGRRSAGGEGSGT